MWYKNSYRRHLCDMHIEDWNDEFMSEFSVDEYVKNLKAENVDNVMIYLQSHVGHCYYPTKTGHIHKAFVGREYDMKRLEELCHKNGIYVTGYYSHLFNTYEARRHPEWKMVTLEDMENKKLGMDFSDAKASRYGVCCPNNEEYRKFVNAQIEEILNYADLDGMFYDMPYWPYFCYCDSCKKRWAEEVGGEIPTVADMNDPLWQKHLAKRREWVGEFEQKATEWTKSIKPGISVENNFASATSPNVNLCCSYEVQNASDFAGGDLYGGPFEHSVICKLYDSITKNKPFEYMFGRCTPNLSMHTVTKSEDQIDTAVFTTAAHHGATLVIDAIDPKGTMDSRFYERMGKSFKKQIPYEKYFKGDMVGDVAVYYSINSNFCLHGNSANNRLSSINAVKTLIENHIPVCVTGCFSELDSYRAIIAPCLTCADETDNQRLIDYVKNGGTLYLSGCDNAPLVKELLNIEVVDYTNYAMVYAAPCNNLNFGWFNKDYPIPFNVNAPIISDGFKGEVLATLTYPYTSKDDERFASIHSNPPGMATDVPAIIKRDFGKGKVIWSAVPIEDSTNYEYKQILISLLGLESLHIHCDADDTTEIVTFKSGDETHINVVELSERYYAKPTRSFLIKVKCDQRPEKVICADNDRIVDFVYENGYVSFKIDEFKIFTMYIIK